MLRTWPFFKTPLERKTEECELANQQIANLRDQVNTLQQLVDMKLLDRCCELETKLAAAHQEIADLHRLFAFKGSAVAGDELQEQIEQRMKKGKENA